MLEIVKIIPNPEDTSRFIVSYRDENWKEPQTADVDGFTADLIRAGMRQGRNQVRTQIRKALEAECEYELQQQI